MCGLDRDSFPHSSNSGALVEFLPVGLLEPHASVYRGQSKRVSTISGLSGAAELVVDIRRSHFDQDHRDMVLG